MPRRPRNQYPGAVSHVTARGNDRRTIFRDPADCRRFLVILEAAVQRYGIVVVAYCLMTNHYHLLVESPRANLSDAMRYLNGVYCQGFNRSLPREGHLLERRYGAEPVETDAHYLEVVRYVGLNPERAGLVTDAADWRWSSHAALAGRGDAPWWLATDRVHARLRAGTPDLDAEQRRYREFVAAARLADEAVLAA